MFSLEQIVYADKSSWSSEDWLLLHLLLSKAVEKNDVQFLSVFDLSKADRRTRVLLSCIINNQRPALLRVSNLECLRHEKPLEEPIILTKWVKKPAYSSMNVVYM